MSQPNRPRPVLLCILDGWGYRKERTHNAIAAAETPVWDRLLADGPWALLETSGRAVGLPEGQMGNSEVGHMSMGAGRVVLQDLPRLDRAFADGGLTDVPAMASLISGLKASGGTAHLMGILSPGGVHGHQDHLASLAGILDAAGISVAIHGFLDGRDTAPSKALEYMNKFLDDISSYGRVRVATVGGRYYAMDRDKRWERVALTYNAMVLGAGTHATDALTVIKGANDSSTSVEFTKPAVLAGYSGMADGDGVIMANFRADRAWQILSALVDPNFTEFPRQRYIDFEYALGMVAYSNALRRYVGTLFEVPALRNTLGEVVSAAGMQQLRIAETEKHSHVTMFLNGGSERAFAGEERVLIPSPRVATYDLKPEMSTPEVTERLISEINGGKFDLIVVNIANGDMVGHTGDYEAALEAAMAVDKSLGQLETTILSAGGVMIVTADHGNLELMQNPDTGEPHTSHTNEPVPIVLVGHSLGVKRLKDGGLADVAPTILELLGIDHPEEMTGRSLIVRSGATSRKAAE